MKFKSVISKIFNIYIGFIYIGLCRSAVGFFNKPVTGDELHYKCIIAAVVGVLILLAALAWLILNVLRLTKKGKSIELVEPVFFAVGLLLRGLCFAATLIINA